MGIVDIVLMVMFIGGAVYLLYRSLWKKKGHCSGCSSETCNLKKTKGAAAESNTCVAASQRRIFKL
jgi:hypothetical protein